jgi:hypothetical protein
LPARALTAWLPGAVSQVDEPGGKPKRERKVGFRQFQVHLPSCPYDCRITVSFESPEDADLSDVPPGWESHRTKRRTSFLASRLPNGITSRWQARVPATHAARCATRGQGARDARVRGEGRRTSRT